MKVENPFLPRQPENFPMDPMISIEMVELSMLIHATTIQEAVLKEAEDCALKQRQLPPLLREHGLNADFLLAHGYERDDHFASVPVVYGEKRTSWLDAVRVAFYQASFGQNDQVESWKWLLGRFGVRAKNHAKGMVRSWSKDGRELVFDPRVEDQSCALASIAFLPLTELREMGRKGVTISAPDDNGSNALYWLRSRPDLKVMVSVVSDPLLGKMVENGNRRFMVGFKILD